ncbi:hypothetical protein C0989_004264 [Termitomyces sp. Mn162]|nr:hypothetical protein C0989_004264 [Termitomyces sp. Mn162]
MSQYFPPQHLRLQHDGISTNTRLSLVHTCNGMSYLIKVQWTLPDDVHPGPNPTPIHLRFVCPFEFVTKEITVKQFLTSNGFISAFDDATEAHAKIKARCKWFHIKVNPSKILIDLNGKGVLTDWDIDQRETKKMTTKALADSKIGRLT